MKKMIILLLCISIYGCGNDKRNDVQELADLNLYLTSNEKIDSLVIFDLSQQRELHIVAFADTIRINFNDSINDNYQVKFLKDGKQIPNPFPYDQLWLKGENIELKGRYDGKLVIDTLIGSDMHYKSLAFRKNFSELTSETSDTIEINKFLLKTVSDLGRDEIFSMDVADLFARRNQNDVEELKKLYAILETKNPLLKNHPLFTSYRDTKALIENKEYDIAQYSFLDRENQSVSIDTSGKKMILMDFWFVGCAPCARDHKIIAKDLKALADNNIKLVSISTTQEFDLWNSYLQENKYDWYNLRFNPNNSDQERMDKEFSIQGYPTYILLNPDGTIAMKVGNYQHFKNYLKIP
jgi:thiol-disulfide isomerase/thioredoxin